MRHRAPCSMPRSATRRGRHPIRAGCANSPGWRPRCTAEDAKLQKLIEVVRELLAAGYQPIVWCRYIATADYVTEELGRSLAPRLPAARVVAITGALAEDERRLKIASLAAAPVRVLVATDCLSEGINLQERFYAVVHYDFPGTQTGWNSGGPGGSLRPESEGSKRSSIFGRDNPVDGAVLDVLLRKAAKSTGLGVRVPMPMDSETVMEAVLHSLVRALHPLRRPDDPL